MYYRFFFGSVLPWNIHILAQPRNKNPTKYIATDNPSVVMSIAAPIANCLINPPANKRAAMVAQTAEQTNLFASKHIVIKYIWIDLV